MINQILDAVKAKLDAVPDFGGSVYKFRVYPFNNTPSANIAYGQLEHQELSGGIVDSTIEIVVQVKVAVVNNDSLAETITDIHSKAYAAIMSDETLGLSFVQNIVPQGSSQPAVSEDTEKPSMSQTLIFECTFRHSRATIQ